MLWLQVVCEALSVPPASRVVWKYKDYPVNTGSQHYQVITKKNEDRVVTTLVIRNAVLADFGQYNCTVRNEYGEDFQLIEIMRRGRSAFRYQFTFNLISYIHDSDYFPSHTILSNLNLSPEVRNKSLHDMSL